jgi:hypothetical protein
MNNKLTAEQEALLRTTGEIHGMSAKDTEAMLRGMAVMVAEFEVMKHRLVQLGEITNTTPARWVEDNKPIVNVEEAIKAYMMEREGQ